MKVTPHSNLHQWRRPRLVVCRRGMTLIELLPAMLIAILLMGVVFAVYMAVMGGFRMETARRDARSPATAALEMLTADLARCFTPALSTNATFVLGPGTNEAMETMLCFFFAHPVESSDGSLYDASRVEYLLMRGGEDGGSIVRRILPLGGGSDADDPPDEEVVLDGVRLFRVALFDGSAWTNRWGDLPGAMLPLAARVGIETDGTAMGTEVLIPAGIKIGAAGD